MEVYIFYCTPLPTEFCDDPTPIHGYTNPPPPLTGRYMVGSSVTVSCSAGFTLSGSNFRTCQADFTWSSKPAQCLIGNGIDPLS